MELTVQQISVSTSNSWCFFSILAWPFLFLTPSKFLLGKATKHRVNIFASNALKLNGERLSLIRISERAWTQDHSGINLANYKATSKSRMACRNPDATSLIMKKVDSEGFEPMTNATLIEMTLERYFCFNLYDRNPFSGSMMTLLEAKSFFSKSDNFYLGRSLSSGKLLRLLFRFSKRY